MVKMNPARLVAQAISGLNPRLKEVISKRYGLKGGRRQTLEAIGKQFGITRERVRQIEVEAFKQLKQPEVLKELEPAFTFFKNHVGAHGDLRKEATLMEADLEKHLGIPGTPEQKAATNFILTLANNHFQKFPEAKNYHTFWTTEPNLVRTLPKFTSSLEDYFRKRNTVAGYTDVKGATELALKQSRATGSNPRVVQAYLGVAKNIGRNVFGEFGLVTWPDISPRGIKDKAYLVLKKENKPIHFKDVAGAITKAGFSNRKAHIQTVHNELIKDDRFVLVGRGTYALKEWGYQPGTVKDVLVEILKAGGRPMAKDEIVSQLMKQRQVKENTILLNLQDKSYFSKTKEGNFTLKT